KAIMTDAQTADTIQRDFYTYDLHNNLTERRLDVKTNGQWRTDFIQKHTYTYNAAFQVTEDITEEWFNNNWEKKAKLNYTFNASGQETGEVVSMWQNGAWKPDIKRLSAYQNNLLSQYTVQHFVNNAWLNFANFTGYLWNSTGTDVITYKEQTWVNNAWLDKNRFTFTYNPAGYLKLTEMLQ